MYRVGLQTAESVVSANNEPTFFTRNARYLWLGALFLPPGFAFAIYLLMPHEEFWHELLYAVLCVPIFFVWLVAVLGCSISFLNYRLTLIGK